MAIVYLFAGDGFGIAFFRDGGTQIIDGGGYCVLDMNDEETAKVPGSQSQEPHLQNFLDAIKSGKKLNQDIEEGHKSTMLCHLGNIAYRTHSTLRGDPKTGRALGNKEASALWGREYRKGWEPKV